MQNPQKKKVPDSHTVAFSLRNIEIILRLTGAGSKNLALLLASLFRRDGNGMAFIALKRVLRDEKSLSIFRVERAQLTPFRRLADSQTIRYAVIRDRQRKDTQASFYVLAHPDSAGRLHRIVEKMRLSAYEISSEEVKPSVSFEEAVTHVFRNEKPPSVRDRIARERSFTPLQ